MIENRVRETSSTEGIGDFDLDGAIDPTFKDFVTGFGDGNNCFYTIVAYNAIDYEIGRGVVHSGTPNTLTRTTVIESSNSGSHVAFTSGLKAVFNGLPKELFTTTPGVGVVPKGDINSKLSNGWLKNSLGYDYFNVITYSSSLPIDLNNGSKQFITLTGNITLTLTNTSADGDVFTLAFKQSGSGHTITWFAGITWPGGAPLQPTTPSGSITYFDFLRMSDGTIYYRGYGSAGGGGGGVDGPGATNVDAIAVWDDTTGTLLRNSLVNIHAGSNDKLDYLGSFEAIESVSGSPGTINFDCDLANNFLVTLAADRTFTFSNVSVGQTLLFRILQNGGDSQASWPTGISWNATIPPILGFADQDWNEISLFCYGIDGYSNPLFIEIGRRGSNVVDTFARSLNLNVTGSLSFPFYDIYTLSGNITLGDPDPESWGRTVTIINSNSSLRTITTSSPVLSNQGSNQESPIVLSSIYESIGLLSTPSGWVLVEDSRDLQFSIESINSGSSVTLAKGTTYARVANGLSTTITVPSGYKGKIVVIKKLGSGTVNVRDGLVTIVTMTIDTEMCLLVWSGIGWEVVLDIQSNSSTGLKLSTVYSVALLAGVDQLTGNNAYQPFATTPYNASSNVMTITRRLKLRASGTWDANGTSGSIFEFGFMIDPSGTPFPIALTNVTYAYTSGQSGTWLAEAELVTAATGSSGKLEANGGLSIDRIAVVSFITNRMIEVAYTTNSAHTFIPYWYCNTTGKAELRSFTVELG